MLYANCLNLLAFSLFYFIPPFFRKFNDFFNLCNVNKSFRSNQRWELFSVVAFVSDAIASPIKSIEPLLSMVRSMQAR